MSNAGWGSNTDMAAIAHGPVGCGAFTQSARDVLPFWLQGVESFSELHFSSDLDRNALAAEGGGGKLSCALDELAELFPLAKGALILNEEPVGLVDSDLRKIALEKSEATGKFITALSCENYHAWGAALNLQEEAANRRAAARLPEDASTPYDVALTFMRAANGLAWIVARLLTDIGHNVIHQYVGSSTTEMGRVTRCKLSIGFAPMLDVPLEHLC
jgi:nitrogenase molybdenum-iron protein alpha chain